MNDFSEIENELTKLRPLPPSAKLLERVENAVVDVDAEQKIIRPDRFQFSWLSLGVGLAAAAVILLFLHLDFHPASQKQDNVAVNSPAPETRSTATATTFIPSGATQVVYNTRDEGLHFSHGSDEPMRRVRSHLRETLHWQNPTTGASLAVSYPSEQVELIPISGQ